MSNNESFSQKFEAVKIDIQGLREDLEKSDIDIEKLQKELVQKIIDIKKDINDFKQYTRIENIAPVYNLEDALFVILDSNPDLLNAYLNQIKGHLDADLLLSFHQAGVIVDSEFVKRFTLEKVYNKKYSEALIKLSEAGIRIDSETIRFLSCIKVNHEKYVDTLIMFHELGAKIDFFFIGALSGVELNNEHFIDTLVKLQKLGIVIDSNFFRNNVVRMLKNEDNVNTLITFKQAVDIDNFSLDSLKSWDKEYIDALIKLHKAEIDIDGSFLWHFDLARSQNQDYIDALIKFHQAGIKVDGKLVKNFFIQQATKAGYVNAMIKMRQSEEIDSELIAYFYPRKFKEEGYVDVLMSLQKEGIKINRSLIKALDSRRVKDEIYLKNLIALHKAGIEINGELVKELYTDKGKDENYIKTLIMLHQAGIKVDSRLIDGFSVEEFKQEQYINAILKMHQAGIEVEPLCRNFNEFTINKLDFFIELHQAGFKVDNNLFNDYFWCKNSASLVKDNIEIFDDLRKIGVRCYDEYLIQSLGSEKMNQAYVDVVVELYNKIGIISFSLSVQKSKDKNYIDTLVKLHQAGIEIDGKFIENFTLEKAKDKIYVQELFALCKLGLTITSSLLSYLTFARIKDKACVERLFILQKLGASFDVNLVKLLESAEVGDKVYMDNIVKFCSLREESDLIKVLTPEKLKNKYYVDVLIKLQKFGIKITDSLIECLTLEKASDENYVNALIVLSSVGINFYGVLEYCPENTLDSVCVNNFIKLDQAGIELYYCLKDFPREKFTNTDYVNALIKLHQGDIEIKHELVLNLTIKKATTVEYIDALISLYKTGSRIREYLLKYFSIEKAENKDYVKILIKLAQAGFDVDGSFVYSFSFEKAENKNYIDKLIKLAQAGFDVDGFFVDSLSIEKAENKDYVKILIKLAQAGFDVDGSFVRVFSIEKAVNEDYVKSLIRLGLAGIKLDDGFISNFVLEKGVNKDYVDALIIFFTNLNICSFERASFIDELPLEEGVNGEYAKKIVQLNKINLKLRTEGFYQFFKPEKINNENYFNALVAFINGEDVSEFLIKNNENNNLLIIEAFCDGLNVVKNFSKKSCVSFLEKTNQFTQAEKQHLFLGLLKVEKIDFIPLVENFSAEFIFWNINNLNVEKDVNIDKTKKTMMSFRLLMRFVDNFPNSSSIADISKLFEDILFEGKELPITDIEALNKIYSAIGFLFLKKGTPEQFDKILTYAESDKNKIARFLTTNLSIGLRRGSFKYRKYAERIEKLKQSQNLLPDAPPRKEILADGKFVSYIYFGQEEFFRSWEADLFERPEYGWKREDRKEEMVYIMHGAKTDKDGKNIPIEVHIPKTFGSNNEKVFEKMNDPNVDYVQYVGHAGGRNQLSSAIQSAYKKYAIKESDQSKIFVGQACWSFKSYAPHIKRVFPYAQYIGTKDISNIVEGQNVFEVILDGVLRDQNWDQIAEEMRKRPSPFIKKNGRWTLPKKTRGITSSNYVLPNDPKILDVIDSDGDGIPDSRDNAHNLIISRFRSEETCDPTLPNSNEQPGHRPLDILNVVDRTREVFFPFVNLGVDESANRYNVQGWHHENDDRNQDLLRIRTDFYGNQNDFMEINGQMMPVLNLDLSFNARFMRASDRALVLMAMKEVGDYLYANYDVDQWKRDFKEGNIRDHDEYELNKEEPDKTKGKEATLYASIVDLMRAFQMPQNRDNFEIYRDLYESFRQKYEISSEIDFITAYQFVWSKAYAGNKDYWRDDTYLRPLYDKYTEYSQKIKNPEQMKDDPHFAKYEELKQKGKDNDTISQHLACEDLMKKLRGKL